MESSKGKGEEVYVDCGLEVLSVWLDQNFPLKPSQHDPPFATKEEWHPLLNAYVECVILPGKWGKDCELRKKYKTFENAEIKVKEKIQDGGVPGGPRAS